MLNTLNAGQYGCQPTAELWQVAVAPYLCIPDFPSCRSTSIGTPWPSFLMVVQTDGEISILGDIQNSTEHGLKQADLSWPCPAMSIGPKTFRGPFQATLFRDSLGTSQASGLPSHPLLWHF